MNIPKTINKIIAECEKLKPGECFFAESIGQKKNYTFSFLKNEKYIENTELYNNVDITAYKVRGKLDPGHLRYKPVFQKNNVKIYALEYELEEIFKKYLEGDNHEGTVQRNS